MKFSHLGDGARCVLRKRFDDLFETSETAGGKAPVRALVPICAAFGKRWGDDTTTPIFPHQLADIFGFNGAREEKRRKITVDESVAGIRVASKMPLTRPTAPGNSRSHNGFWQDDFRPNLAS